MQRFRTQLDIYVKAFCRNSWKSLKVKVSDHGLKALTTFAKSSFIDAYKILKDWEHVSLLHQI